MEKLLFMLLVCLAITSCGGSSGNTPCTTLDCKTLKYSLFMADVNFSQANPAATNIQLIASSSFQDMTHPRISPDKLWVAYTTYNDTNGEGCATVDQRANTEIKATRLDGSQTKTIISKTNSELTTNNYWYGINNEFTFLAGAPGVTKIYRAQTDSAMNLISGPTEVTIPATILPFDPHAISDTQLVYGGQYDSSGSDVKSIFLQTLNPSGMPTGLSLGRDSVGTILLATDVMENDPKISPDGNNIAFMRQAPNSGVNGFGFRIFVVPIANPLSEANISASLGSTIANNDALPEWVDNTTLVFSNIDSTVTFNTRTIWTMKSDGTGRKQISLPTGYRYSDIIPFLSGSGNQKIIVSAEKIDAICAP